MDLEQVRTYLKGSNETFCKKTLFGQSLDKLPNAENGLILQRCVCATFKLKGHGRSHLATQSQ